MTPPLKALHCIMPLSGVQAFGKKCGNRDHNILFCFYWNTILFWANVKIHAAVKYNTPWCYGERCLHLYEMIIFDQIMFTILALKSLRKCVANVLRSSGVSWKSGALIVRHSQKKERISFLQLLYLWKNWSDSCGVFSKMYLSKWALQSTRKLKMSNVHKYVKFSTSDWFP